MKVIHKITVLLVVFSVFSCGVKTNVSGKKDIKVLILGNSILYHAPKPELDWTGDWGMAATAAEKDFLHVYTNLLQTSAVYQTVTVDHQNISAWETNFDTNLKQFDKSKDQKYDVLIIRLGENVVNTKQYKDALIKMIQFYKSKKTKVILTGTIWENQKNAAIHQQVAVLYNYEYISFEDFRANVNNFAFNTYKNTGVAAHPSDTGMYTIAELLYGATLKVYK